MIESFSQNKYILKAKMLKEAGLYPFFRPIEASESSTVQVGNKRQIMIGSNNYLGLTHHPYVIEAAVVATKKYGTGCTGSRFLNGNLKIHEELEERLAEFVGHEAALVFSTGMQTNLGAISSIGWPQDCILSDSENHASIIDAIKLSRAVVFKYNHNDMQSLENLLQEHQGNFNKMIIAADGVFSMTGELLNLPEVVRLAKKYKAMTYVDDAHGLGVLGSNGQGTVSHFGLTADVDLNMGTFSKSFASIGGFVSGSKELINFVKHTARSFIFSAAMPPSAVATVMACLDVVEREPEIFTSLWENVRFMQHGFREIGFYTHSSQTPIIPIFIGDDLKAMQVTKYLFEKGIFATPVMSPAVAEGESLIRTSYMATHRRQDLEYVLDTFAKAKKLFEIPCGHH